LQVLFVSTPHRLRMVEPIVQTTFGPRVGHGNLSSWTMPRRREGCRRRCVLRGEATQFDPLVTISLCSQLAAIKSNGFGLFELFGRLSDSPPIATGCIRSAPQMLHSQAPLLLPWTKTSASRFAS
jgi:hypothetical protein